MKPILLGTVIGLLFCACAGPSVSFRAQVKAESLDSTHPVRIFWGQVSHGLMKSLLEKGRKGMPRLELFQILGLGSVSTDNLESDEAETEEALVAEACARGGDGVIVLRQRRFRGYDSGEPFLRAAGEYDNTESDFVIIRTAELVPPGSEKNLYSYEIDHRYYVNHVVPAWKDGKRHGVWKYFEGQRLVRFVSYREGLKHGLQWVFVREGEPARVTFYAEGKEQVKQGLLRIPSLDGYSETPYVDGKIQGVQKVFDKKGRLLKATGYKKGVLHGEAKRYDPACDPPCLVSEANFREGKAIGESKTFDRQGRLRSRTPYVEGRAHGVEEHYDADGRVETYIHWRHGKKHGPVREPRFSDYVEGEYEEGKRQGEFITKTKDGRIREIVQYKDGKKVRDQSFFKNGKLSVSCGYRDGKRWGDEKVYDRSGNLKSHTQYAYGKKNGLELIYNTKGVVVREVEYTFGRRNGRNIERDDQGRMKSDCPTKAGKPHGTCRLYYPSGKVKKEIEYVEGRDVRSTWYDEQGKVTATHGEGS